MPSVISTWLRKIPCRPSDAYEKGVAKATRSGIEKGVLLLHLGDIYWVREKFSDAQRCYGEAIGLLDKERKDTSSSPTAPRCSTNWYLIPMP